MMDQDLDPRTPCGVRLVHRLCGQQGQAISIHAPHAGVRRSRSGRSPCARYFNPRTPCGVRLSSKRSMPLKELFQSTHPRGVRPTAQKWIISSQAPFQSTHPRGVRLTVVAICHSNPANFNPRTREGCDRAGDILDRISAVFQSTHPRGVRLLGSSASSVAPQFQSAHPIRGATGAYRSHFTG